MDKKERALIIDDDVGVLIVMRQFLTSLGYEAETAERGSEGLDLMKKQPAFDVVFLDQNLPDISGLNVLVKIVESSANTQVIMMTAYGNVSDAVLAIKRGAYDYLIKPVSVEQVELVADRAMSVVRLKDEVRQLRERLEDERLFGKIISCSESMRHVLEKAKKIAALDSNVLLSGESGTGKELVARAIHESSSQKKGPFIAVNCAALTEDLLGSALFGYVKGAFTGADRTTKGCFEEAAGGTLFLDEVGDMSPKLQSSLLRVIQEKEFSRLGSYTLIKADFRLLTATNKEMEEEVNSGRFRKDLFFRLNVIPIKIPPLRDRKEDIPLLVLHFIEKFNRRLGKKAGPCAAETMTLLMNHSWPGNCRELENAFEYAVAVKNDGEIKLYDLPEYLIDHAALSDSEREKALRMYQDERNMFDRKYLKRALELSQGSITQMAKITGIRRQNIYKKLKKHGIQ